MRYRSSLLLGLGVLFLQTPQAPRFAGCYVFTWPDSLTRDSAWSRTFIDSLRLDTIALQLPPQLQSRHAVMFAVGPINGTRATNSRWSGFDWASWERLPPDSMHITLSTDLTQWDLDLHAQGNVVEGEGTYAVGDGLEGPFDIRGVRVLCPATRRAPN